MAANWHELLQQEASTLRKMSDAAAFDHIVATYPPGDAKNAAHALYLIGRRPWRNAFPIPLAKRYLKDVHGDTFKLAIQSLLTFIRCPASYGR